MTRVSIITPTYNRPEHIESLLETLRAQTFKNFEIIISDDGSSDSPYSVVKKFESTLNVKYIRQGRKRPFNESEARNLGIKLSLGEILLFNDDDCFFHKKCVEGHVKRHRLKDRLMVWGDLYYHPTLRVSQVVSYVKSEFPKGAELHKHRSPKNFSVRREEVFKINGFDQDFCGGYGKKDAEFKWRLRRSGVAEVLAPECKALAIRAHSGQSEDKSRNQELFRKMTKKSNIACINGIMDLSK